MGSISNIVCYVINYHCAKFGAFTINSTILVKFCTILLDCVDTSTLRTGEREPKVLVSGRYECHTIKDNCHFYSRLMHMSFSYIFSLKCWFGMHNISISFLLNWKCIERLGKTGTINNQPRLTTVNNHYKQDTTCGIILCIDEMETSTYPPPPRKPRAFKLLKTGSLKFPPLRRSNALPYCGILSVKRPS